VAPPENPFHVLLARIACAHARDRTSQLRSARQKPSRHQIRASQNAFQATLCRVAQRPEFCVIPALDNLRQLTAHGIAELRRDQRIAQQARDALHQTPWVERPELTRTRFGPDLTEQRVFGRHALSRELMYFG
jgi:hypothetical protein